MIGETAASTSVSGTSARLYLDGKEVGVVMVRGSNHSWGYGDFTPSEAFGEFAALFGQWSLLMHADGEASPLSRPASEELRHTEYRIDHLHAKLLLTNSGQWRSISQVNIDGPLIEWKER